MCQAKGRKYYCHAKAPPEETERGFAAMSRIRRNACSHLSREFQASHEVPKKNPAGAGRRGESLEAMSGQEIASTSLGSLHLSGIGSTPAAQFLRSFYCKPRWAFSLKLPFDLRPNSLRRRDKSRRTEIRQGGFYAQARPRPFDRAINRIAPRMELFWASVDAASRRLLRPRRAAKATNALASLGMNIQKHASREAAMCCSYRNSLAKRLLSLRARQGGAAERRNTSILVPQIDIVGVQKLFGDADRRIFVTFADKDCGL